MLITADRPTREWTVEIREHDAVFRFSPLVEDHTAISTRPRVWAGRGLGVAGTALPGLRAGLGEVMRTPAYWRARGDSASAWRIPRWDAEDGFVRITGPAGAPRGDAGYRAVPCFSVTHPESHGLRVRVAGYPAG
ncbi:hypothetical protein [Amycolatopsis sp. NPDC051071]|uniref:hypothetical protein n=1 Tax=Amycolatopsis sp. NPDC051071 TaxID=3154637 RepID=UPI003415E3FF